MKKIIFLFIIFLGFLFLNNFFAFAEMQINEDGEIRQVEIQKNWRSLTEAEKRAVENPGEEILSGRVTVKMERDPLSDFFHYIPIQEYSEITVFDGESVLPKKTVVWGECRIYRTVFLLIGLCAMFYSNYRVKSHGFCDDAAFFSSLAAATAVVAAAAVTVIDIAATTIVAAATTVVAVVVAVVEEKTFYKFFSVVFYIAVIIAMFV